MMYIVVISVQAPNKYIHLPQMPVAQGPFSSSVVTMGQAYQMLADHPIGEGRRPSSWRENLAMPVIPYL